MTDRHSGKRLHNSFKMVYQYGTAWIGNIGKDCRMPGCGCQRIDCSNKEVITALNKSYMATSIYLSKITKVDFRDCWQNEATDFTPWLATEENMSLLADALEIIM